MPRGPRKNNKEKLLEKQREIIESISQYKAAIKTLEQQADSIQEELSQLDMKEITVLMNEKHLTTVELKSMIESYLTN